jgi:hypothetical protein
LDSSFNPSFETLGLREEAAEDLLPLEEVAKELRPLEEAAKGVLQLDEVAVDELPWRRRPWMGCP